MKNVTQFPLGTGLEAIVPCFDAAPAHSHDATWQNLRLFGTGRRLGHFDSGIEAPEHEF